MRDGAMLLSCIYGVQRQPVVAKVNFDYGAPLVRRSFRPAENGCADVTSIELPNGDIVFSYLSRNFVMVGRLSAELELLEGRSVGPDIFGESGWFDNPSVFYDGSVGFVATLYPARSVVLVCWPGNEICDAPPVITRISEVSVAGDSLYLLDRHILAVVVRKETSDFRQASYWAIFIDLRTLTTRSETMIDDTSGVDNRIVLDREDDDWNLIVNAGWPRMAQVASDTIGVLWIGGRSQPSAQLVYREIGISSGRAEAMVVVASMPRSCIALPALCSGGNGGALVSWCALESHSWQVMWRPLHATEGGSRVPGSGHVYRSWPGFRRSAIVIGGTAYLLWAGSLEGSSGIFLASL